MQSRLLCGSDERCALSGDPEASGAHRRACIVGLQRADHLREQRDTLHAHQVHFALTTETRAIKKRAGSRVQRPREVVQARPFW